jgi:hypothetical protein
MISDNKQCTHCDLILPLDNFYSSKRFKDGKHYYCKECDKELARTDYLVKRSAKLTYAAKYRDDNKDRIKDYRLTNPNVKLAKKKNYTKRRFKVFQTISENSGSQMIKCNRCGCTQFDLLEINHINGGGKRNGEHDNTYAFYSGILKGERKTEDLEILCKICNAWHYLELKCGQRLPFKVIWEGSNE